MGDIKQHVSKLMTQSQMTDAFTEHVLTLIGLIYQAMDGQIHVYTGYNLT